MPNPLTDDADWVVHRAGGVYQRTGSDVMRPDVTWESHNRSMRKQRENDSELTLVMVYNGPVDAAVAMGVVRNLYAL